MKVSVMQQLGLSINARCHLSLAEGGEAGTSSQKGLQQATPSATSPHTALVSCGTDAQAQLLCESCRPDSQDQHKIVCSSTPQGNQNRLSECPLCGPKLEHKGSKAKSPKPYGIGTAKHLQAHISLPSI